MKTGEDLLKEENELRIVKNMIIDNLILFQPKLSGRKLYYLSQPKMGELSYDQSRLYTKVVNEFIKDCDTKIRKFGHYGFSIYGKYSSEKWFGENIYCMISKYSDNSDCVLEHSFSFGLTLRGKIYFLNNYDKKENQLKMVA